MDSPDAILLTLIAIKKEKDELFLAKENTNTSIKLESDLAFEPMTLTELKSQMLSLKD